MRVALDLRGLNYRSFTGINNYTLRLLTHLPERTKTKAIEYTCLGLTEEAKRHLVAVCPRLREAKFMSLRDYYKTPWPASPTLSSALSVAAQRLSPYSRFCAEFDYLLLPQPKAIQIHPRTKLVTVFHDCFGVTHPEYLSTRHRFVENLGIYKRLARASTTCLVNSYATGSDLRKYLGVPDEKISLNYPADLDSTAPPVPDTSPLPRPYFLAVSGIEPRKNWLNIVGAYREFARRFPGTDLVLLGHPVSPKYLKQVQKTIDNQANILLLLEASETIKRHYLRHARALLYPSFYEGFGFPILEAHRYGVPVITSRVGSMPEIAGAGALYVNPLRCTEITAALEILHLDSPHAARLRAAARENYARFDWVRFAEGLATSLQARPQTN